MKDQLLTKKVEKRGRKKFASKPCLIKTCSGLSKVRGLCGSCYTNAGYLVTCGKTTWDFLEKNNLARPVNRPISLFVIEFEKLIPREKLKGKKHLQDS